MKFYAVRHKPSKAFLPAGRSRGFTKDEPMPGLPPRLFTSKRGAEMALRAWLKGPWDRITEHDYDDWSGKSYSYVAGGKPPATPPEDRKAGDMEVVVIRLETA